jgi:hypothetical protein
MPAPHAMSIPLQEVTPHPRLAFRFRYDVDSLADSIVATADESTPNGQLNPGRVVRTEAGDGYYVYIGVRRFLAMKLVFSKTKDQRFGVFNAYVDEGLTELQMFVKAKAENEEEKGERLAPSLLEQVSGIRKIRDVIDPAKVGPAIKRLLALADGMDEERLHRLREAEWATQSSFRQTQLEGLSKMDGGDREFYTTAATMVAFGERDAGEAMKKRDAAFYLNWFSRVFPEIKKGPSTQQHEDDTEKEVTERDPGLEVHEEGVILVSCRKCGGGNMFKSKGQVELTHIPPGPSGEARTIVADTVSRVKLVCSHCEAESFVFVEHLGGERYAVSIADSGAFREPEEKTDALDLRFDFGNKAWQRVTDGKIVGEVSLAPNRQRR